MAPSARKPTLTRGQGEAQAADAAAGTRGKPAQRIRLINAMIELAAKAGYQAVSIAQVSSHAGVSSATFYEQFEDKEDCLLAAYDAARERVLVRRGGMPRSMGRCGACLAHGPEREAPGRPRRRRAWCSSRRWRARRACAATARPCSSARRSRSAPTSPDRPRTATTLDIPVAALEGARRYIISRHLRTHSVDLLPVSWRISSPGWTATRSRRKRPRWSAGPKALLSAAEARRAVKLPEQVLVAAAPAAARPSQPSSGHGRALPPGEDHRRYRRGDDDQGLREREHHGHRRRPPGIARDVFYEHFENKQHAFLETQQFVTQAVLEICGSAYFGGQDWPERDLARARLDLRAGRGVSGARLRADRRVLRGGSCGCPRDRGAAQNGGAVPRGRLFVRRARVRRFRKSPRSRSRAPCSS